VAAWVFGRCLKLEDVMAFALQPLVAYLNESQAATPPDGLTPREIEVLQLIAAGRSNRQMAEDLFLSIRTVERHVANIYRKIDVHNRAEATAYAIQHRLVDTPTT
jgi:DNA-binding NarL/FixJ family response regulator